MSPTALILGPTGKIGSHAARAFGTAGWQVRSYRRGTDMTEAARGCEVIVNGLNPPNYHDWARQIPAITGQVIAAARRSGATVILPGNVYVFGDKGGTWSETTPHTPVSRKGRIRAEMEQAYRDSGIRTITLRAGNFIDPDHNGDVMALLLLRNIARGRITAMGDPDVEQAYCYLPDWADAARRLAERRGSLEAFEDIPFPGHSFTLTQMKTLLETELGRPLAFERFPWWAITLAAPVWELARELREMRYLWNTPHRLDGAKLARLLPEFAPTDLRSVLRAALPGDIHPDKPVRPGGQSVIAK
jgi:nucleoside-diphosphate-sugar epimerase